MKEVVTAVIAWVLILAATSNADNWSVDVAHSSIGFSVRHMVVAKTTGKFNDFEGTVQFDGKNIEKGSASIAAQVASIDTDDQKRDDHLRSADFFDVEKYPSMSFKSKKVVKGEGNEFQLVGDLTIKDVTKEVTFDCEFHGLVTDPMGNTRAGFSAETSIDRQDFNVKWNKTLDAGGLVVGNEVTVNLEIELVKATG